MLAPMAADLVDRLATLVAVRRYPGIVTWVLLILVLCALRVMSLCNILSVELLLFLFGVFWGMCGENSCNVFLLLFMVLSVPIFATLCMRAVMMLWHAIMFLGLRFFPLFFFLLGALRCFFL
jgi:hypothetical protein